MICVNAKAGHGGSVVWYVGSYNNEKGIFMRPRHLIHTDMFEAMGGVDYVASLCRVEPGTVRKWRQNPDINGRDIPIVKFQDLLEEAGRQLNNLPLQHLVNEYLHDHLLNRCHRIAIPTDKAYELSRLLTGTEPARKDAAHGS